MDNVVKGPWADRRPGPRYTEDEENALLIHGLTVDLTDILFDGILAAGFDNLGDLCYSKDLALINESIRSYLFRLQDRYHPCQDVADKLFEWSENGDQLMTQQSISVEFPKE